MNQKASAERENAEQSVVAYLDDHPEFFERHPSLLTKLRIPHASGGATSLLEKQLQVLREANHALDQRMKELMAVGRENDQLSDRMQALALELIRADSLDGVLAAVRKTLANEFRADVTVLRIGAVPTDEALADSLEFLNPGDPGLALFEDFFAVGHPKVGRLQTAQSEYLFGSDAESISCVALVPLRRDDWRGFVAVGSHDPNRFQPGMGTYFLRRMGQLISQALEPYLRGVKDSAAS